MKYYNEKANESTYNHDKNRFYPLQTMREEVDIFSWQKFDFSSSIVQFELATYLHVFGAHATLANTMYMYDI